MSRGLRVVALGGGTGLPVVLRALRGRVDDLCAVVTVTDDGGSSGRLRRELGMLPPGDLRNCLVALAGGDPWLARLFQYRFPRGELAGHALGNLILCALADELGDLQAAAAAAGRLLRARGRVLPVTLADVRLGAELADGRTVRGQTAIVAARGVIRRVFLEPGECPPAPGVLEALAAADLIVLGPGSLYSSVVPNLLVPGVADAIRRAAATRVYVVNLMTQPGETDGYAASDHLRALVAHAGPGLVDWAVVHAGPIAPAVVERYRAQGAEPVTADVAALQALGVQVEQGALADAGPVLRHDPERLGRALVALGVRRRLSTASG